MILMRLQKRMIYGDQTEFSHVALQEAHSSSEEILGITCKNSFG